VLVLKFRKGVCHSKTAGHLRDTELTMKTAPLIQQASLRCRRRFVAADDDDRRGDRNQPIPLTVPKRSGGPNDIPRPRCRPGAGGARAAGFKGFTATSSSSAG